jgi:hypothetical protein
MRRRAAEPLMRGITRYLGHDLNLEVNIGSDGRSRDSSGPRSHAHRPVRVEQSLEGLVAVQRPIELSFQELVQVADLQQDRRAHRHGPGDGRLGGRSTRTGRKGP